MSPRRYLIIALGLAAVLVAGVAAINVAADPFGLDFAKGALDGGRAPEGPGAFWRKALAVARIAPATVLLGTSRMENGIDARSPMFDHSARPVMNLALGAVSIDQIRLLLIHACESAPVRTAVIGLDLESFLDPGRPDFDPAALTGNAESEPGPLVRARIAVSREALVESLARWTFFPRGPTESTRRDVTADTPLADTEIDLRPFGGQRGLIWIAEFGNFYTRARYLFPKWPPGTRWDDDRQRAASMRAFRQLLDFARRQHVDVRLFISPVHARYLEWYQRVGWWPQFEAWKRALVDVVDAESRANPGRAAIVLWDFSGYHTLAVEPVPALDDATARMRWYRDTSHYSHATGNLILARVLGDTGSDADGLPDARLTPSTIERQLAEIRNGSIAYRLGQPREAENITDMVMRLRQVAGK